MSKEIRYYYSKPIVKLGDCKTGDWVYDDCAKLCYVEKNEEMDWFSLHSYGIESIPGKDTLVYPLTHTTKEIMDKMSAHRDKYYKANIMNPDFSRELAQELHNLMLIDVYDEKYQEKAAEIWARLDKKFDELMVHAEALHIRPKRY